MPKKRFQPDEIRAFELGDEVVFAAVDWYHSGGTDPEATDNLMGAVSAFVDAIPEKWRRQAKDVEMAVDAHVKAIIHRVFKDRRSDEPTE